MSFTPISSDPIADTTALQNTAATQSKPGAFDSVLSGLSAAAYYSGDTINSFAETFGTDAVASISGVTTQAVYQSAGAAATMATSTTGTYGSTGGTSSYLTGGYSGLTSSSLGSTSSYLSGSSDDLTTMYEDTGMQMDELMLFQMVIGQQSMEFTVKTNVEKNRVDSLKAAAANMK